MILTRIQIENYKQYTGPNEILIPSQATIGVIGENGAGKTTLFEAIEWCLYSPRTISPSDVRPRGATGHTTVAVHLESVDGSQRYIVERVLKRTPSATVYRVDGDGEVETVVQGTRQVTDFVAARLIGLSHTAFTATFFTRQKELHLFGDQAPGKRREEVGRLLGLETIRTAQRRFTQERSRANAEARALAGQYERESQGRDFDRELADANTAIEESGKSLALSAEGINATRVAIENAETAQAQVQQRREEDTSLAQSLADCGRERQGHQARQAQIAADLVRIEERAAERMRHAPIAAQLDGLKEQVRLQELERTRFEQATDLDRRRRTIELRRRDLNGTVRSAVDGVDGQEVEAGWVWSTDDMLNPIDGLNRLIGIIAESDVHAAEQRARALQAAFDASTQLAHAESILKQYQDARSKIDREEQELLIDGEPRDDVPRLDQEREKLLESRTTLFANRTSLEGDRDATRTLVGNLDHRHFGDDCPTCGRPFSENDAVIVIAAMRQRETEISSRIEEIVAETAAVERQITKVEQRRQAVFTRMEKLDKVRQRIQKSMNYLEKQLESVDAARQALATALVVAGILSPPTEDECAAAGQKVRHVRSLHHAQHTLSNCLSVFTSAREEEAALTAEREALGEVEFDHAAYKRLVEACQDADRAQATIAQIDHELARKPDLEAESRSIATRLAELDKSIAETTAQRAVLRYDPAELATAQAALKQALDAERAAITEYHRSESTLRQAEMRREAITAEQQRLGRLAAAADARQSEADHLELMAKEFTEFERFAASRKVPVLGEYTSALVRSITDGRYERVEFDQDFGIVVFDGDDTESSYDVDTFSGGERDAITLAARIALSQMIGRQAAHPPGFLVLDEVFGSLDSDRRAHLLDLLGSISATFDELRQVFIISHVDDVRTSPVLDELWQIDTSEDGVSKVYSLRPGADIDAI